jgi:membrane protein required for colicin V production
MEAFPFAIADIAIAGVLLVSALFAYMRGLVKEVLAVGAWIGASFATLYGFSIAKPYVQQVISVQLIANIVTGLAIFIVTLILLYLISHAVSKGVKGSTLSALDRALGFVFGLARGAILICLLYLGASWVWTVEELPEFILQARALPVVEQGAGMLKALVPEHPEDAEAANSSQQNETNFELRALTQPIPKASGGAANGTQPSYDDRERKELQRLIESN